MADSYIIKNEIEIRRQEGDTGNITIIIPEQIDLDGMVPILHVVDRKLNTIFKKEDSDWSINDQTISCSLLPTDTRGKSGNHKWELQLQSLNEVITVGRGNFLIIKEIITEEDE